MSDKLLSRARYGEAFWRAHHEALRHSEFNQREYCEAQGIPLKAFGNWRAKFKAEPQPAARKLLYRRGGLSHTLGHSPSHRLSHMTDGSPASGPIIPPAREGHRQRFGGRDAELLAPEFRSLEPGALSDQEPFTAWLRRGAGGHHRISAEPKLYEPIGTRDAILLQSRQRFGRPRQDIETTPTTPTGQGTI